MRHVVDMRGRLRAAAVAMAMAALLPAASPSGGQEVAPPVVRELPRAGLGPVGAAEVTIARLRYGGGGDWYCDPSSLPNWLDEFQRRTGIPAGSREAVVTLDSENLYRHPFLYASGHGRIAMSPKELEQLRRYLEAGGFLYVDDNYGLDPSFRALVRDLYPDSPLAPIGPGHPIYRAWYDLPGLPKIHEHDGEPAQAFGVVRGGRLVIFYSYSSDIGDGLEDPGVHGDPPEVREAAIKMAVNILVYALTRP